MRRYGRFVAAKVGKAMGRRWTRVGNRIGVWMYRHLNGRLSSGSKTVHVLMITTPGRRTGIPRSTCVRYLETSEGGYVVWGTGSGSLSDPDWFKNLRHVTTTQIQVRDRHLEVRVHEVLGEERDLMWRETILVGAPGVDRYARKAARPIPVAVLDPI